VVLSSESAQLAGAVALTTDVEQGLNSAVLAVNDRMVAALQITTLLQPTEDAVKGPLA
jgi:hypothetical protein